MKGFIQRNESQYLYRALRCILDGATKAWGDERVCSVCHREEFCDEVIKLMKKYSRKDVGESSESKTVKNNP